MDGAQVKIDIFDLCNLLQAFGFTVKDIFKETNDSNEKTGKSIQLKCNISNITATLESKEDDCSCPNINDVYENDKWEMSGTSGGIQVSITEPKFSFYNGPSRNRLTSIRSESLKLLELMRKKSLDVDSSTKLFSNLSVSSSCLLKSPKELGLQIKGETPNRYRSLDAINDNNYSSFPEPRVLSELPKLDLESNLELRDNKSGPKSIGGIVRQNTYTTSPTESVLQAITPARTSSPVPRAPAVVLLNLHQAEKINEELGFLIQECIKAIDHEPIEKSPGPLNVSKISKTAEMRARSGSNVSSRSVLPYVSSPNLGRIAESKRLSLSQKRLSYKFSLSKQDSISLKRNIPKRLTAISSSVMGTKKGSGAKVVKPLIGQSLTGSYKALNENGATTSRLEILKKKLSPNLPTNKETEPKKRTSLYSHIKSTIPKPSKK